MTIYTHLVYEIATGRCLGVHSMLEVRRFYSDAKAYRVVPR